MICEGNRVIPLGELSYSAEGDRLLRVIAGLLGMAGGSVTAVRLALEHGVGFHPGGGLHHGMPDHAEGFCYVHDVATAGERLRAEGRLGRCSTSTWTWTCTRATARP